MNSSTLGLEQSLGNLASFFSDLGFFFLVLTILCFLSLFSRPIK